MPRHNRRRFVTFVEFLIFFSKEDIRSVTDGNVFRTNYSLKEKTNGRATTHLSSYKKLATTATTTTATATTTTAAATASKAWPSSFSRLAWRLRNRRSFGDSELFQKFGFQKCRPARKQTFQFLILCSWQRRLCLQSLQSNSINSVRSKLPFSTFFKHEKTAVAKTSEVLDDFL